MSSFTILVVCTGNICRSPFAAELLKIALAEPSDGVVVHSAGTHAVVGSPMHELAAAELARFGGSAEGFRARQLSDDLLASADLVLTMTRAHRARVLEERPRALRRCFTLREFAALIRLAPPAPGRCDPVTIVADAAAHRAELAGMPGTAFDIADPFGEGPAHYRAMAEDVAAAVGDIGDVLRGALAS